MDDPQELKVFISHRDSICDECHEELGRNAWITLTREQGALCLECSDLGHLAFLPSGNTALTRRAKKHSQLAAVVLRWSTARKRYERQGLLVEEDALAKAEYECLADADSRERRREREAYRRVGIDEAFVQEFAARIREMFPGCPPAREQAIAEHACKKHSDRVGRSAAAKQFDEKAIRLAVAAHARHVETNYDTLLCQGTYRDDARREVAPQVAHVLEQWASKEARPRLPFHRSAHLPRQNRRKPLQGLRPAVVHADS